MKSHLTQSFLACFEGLPQRVKDSARRSYKLWRQDPHHPSLQFKRVGRKYEACSVRVGIKEGDAVIWFWVGSHAEYDQRLKKM